MPSKKTDAQELEPIGIKDGKVQFRPKRNNRATAAARRAQKVQEAFTKARRGKGLFGIDRS